MSRKKKAVIEYDDEFESAEGGVKITFIYDTYENQCKRAPIPRKRKSKKDSDSIASDDTVEK